MNKITMTGTVGKINQNEKNLQCIIGALLACENEEQVKRIKALITGMGLLDDAECA